MSKNVGLLDRLVRAFVGLGMLAFALQWVFPGSQWNWLGWFGIVPLFTAFVGFCPAYRLIGVSTCKPSLFR